MEVGGSSPAGSSRRVRLDPFALPIRFEADDARADERKRVVDLTRDRVVLRRAVSGMRMAVNLPLATYLGVALRLLPPTDRRQAGVCIMLEHRDPALTLPLFEADDAADAIAEWHSWSRALGLPLLVEQGGDLREPFPRLGHVQARTPTQRRRRRSALGRRRPSMLLRRKPGRLRPVPFVHRGEREIIART